MTIYTDASGHLLQSFVGRQVDLSGVDKERNAAGVEVLEMLFNNARQTDDPGVCELCGAASLTDHRRAGRLVLASHAVLHLDALVVPLVVHLRTPQRHLDQQTNINHRLNASSRPLLTATPRSYGSAKNSTPHRIETPDLIEIKFDAADYVGEMTSCAKFIQMPPMGHIGKLMKYTQTFIMQTFIHQSISETAADLEVVR